jgi:hypothetical protein
MLFFLSFRSLFNDTFPLFPKVGINFADKQRSFAEQGHGVQFSIFNDTFSILNYVGRIGCVINSMLKIILNFAHKVPGLI